MLFHLMYAGDSAANLLGRSNFLDFSFAEYHWKQLAISQSPTFGKAAGDASFFVLPEN